MLLFMVATTLKSLNTFVVNISKIVFSQVELSNASVIKSPIYYNTNLDSSDKLVMPSKLLCFNHLTSHTQVNNLSANKARDKNFVLICIEKMLNKINLF